MKNIYTPDDVRIRLTYLQKGHNTFTRTSSVEGVGMTTIGIRYSSNLLEIERESGSWKRDVHSNLIIFHAP